MAEAGGLQLAFDGLLSLVSGGGLLVLKGIKDDNRSLIDKHDALVNSLPETYARRDDVTVANRKLDAALKSLARIEGRLGAKPGD